MEDYKNRSYLSAIEVATYLGINVTEVHNLADNKIIKFEKAASGQYRFNIKEIDRIKDTYSKKNGKLSNNIEKDSIIKINETYQRLIISNSQSMKEIEDNSINLIITSPPYFNTKMYSSDNSNQDLGNIHDLEICYNEIGKVWKEVFRVLQPGRKFFLNIMNLPIRIKGTFKTLNLVGKSIDLCEDIGFIFKRDIVWHKTNGVKAHFGTYPYPGGILLNNMHEFILEFNKPEKKGVKKYQHVSEEEQEQSKLDKDFWLSIKNSDVWLMKPEKSGDNRKHIAPFPIELPYKLIKAFSYKGEKVLDPFMGSGTTLIACSILGRNGIGYDINSDYSIITKNRLLDEELKLFSI